MADLTLLQFPSSHSTPPHPTLNAIGPPTRTGLHAMIEMRARKNTRTHCTTAIPKMYTHHTQSLRMASPEAALLASSSCSLPSLGSSSEPEVLRRASRTP
eukprot:Sspe_Gene.44260::Locus_21686_Transcript_2_2_Confidence_0.667_Length_653::g.44260::m.44260